MAEPKAAISALLIDLDGVIYQGDRVISGALEALDWIRRRDIPHLFVTNTTSRPRDALLEKFERMGFTAARDELMTPVVAATRHLGEHELRRVALFVPEATQAEFDRFEVVARDTEGEVDAVVIGDLGDAWDYAILNQAFRLLMREPRPRLIALGMTRYWRGPDGLRLDVAPFVKALEHAASCQAWVAGKPAPAFFESSLAMLNCAAADALMVGDDIVADIDAAQRCGIRGLQVRTGKFREADLDGDIEPYALLDSFADLPGWWSRAG